MQRGEAVRLFIFSQLHTQKSTKIQSWRVENTVLLKLNNLSMYHIVHVLLALE